MSRIFERIENFNRAFNLFVEMRNSYVAEKNSNAYRLALAKSFKIACEQGWKVIKDYLFMKNIQADTPKDTIKKAYNSNIIENGQIWIDMINDRNATSHEYNIDKVDMILEKISTTYYDELVLFKNWLRGVNGI